MKIIKQQKDQNLVEFKKQTAEKIDYITDALENNMEQNRQLQQHINNQQEIEIQHATKVEQLREQRTSFKSLLAKLIIHVMSVLKLSKPIASLESYQDFQAQADIIFSQPLQRYKSDGCQRKDSSCQANLDFHQQENKEEY